MTALPESDEALVKRLLPSLNADPEDRARAWAEWHARNGGEAVLKFIRVKNNTAEPDEDVFQDAMLTAFLEVERGRYEHRAGIPFTAYVKGIAYNKIREARRKQRHCEAIDDLDMPASNVLRQVEHVLERAERRRALRQGLLHLPVQRRRVLEHYLGGESLSEIAVRLEMSAELVRQHKHRGVRRLQEMSLFG